MKYTQANKPLVVLDIDGTLLDENYQMNDPLLPTYIAKLERQGIAFCVNSNRSLHDLLPVAKRFGISGPLIGENGVFVYNPRTSSSTYLLSQKQLEIVSEQKEIAEKLLFQQLQLLFPERKVFWENIDTVDKISHHETGKYRKESIVVLNNKYRQYTVSAHLKYFTNGEFVSMRNEVQHVADKLRVSLGNQLEVNVSYSSMFSNILVSSRLTSKRAALKALREQEFGYRDLYVIGDEIGDFKMIDGLGTFLTTANAAKSVKTKAKHVAASIYGKGVTELLDDIAKQAI